MLRAFVIVICLLPVLGFVQPLIPPFDRSELIGKWAHTSVLIDGVEQPDYMTELDSGYFWFRADSTFRFGRNFANAEEVTYTDGTWSYDVKKNLLVMNRTDQRKPMKFVVKEVTVTSLVLVSTSKQKRKTTTIEYQFRKVK